MLGWSSVLCGDDAVGECRLFRHASAVSGKVFIWAPIAWALVGYSLSGWRMLRKSESDGSDAMFFSAVLGLVTAGCCLFLPSTPPANTGGDAIQQAFGMLRQPNFLLFIVTSICVAGTMQFYFLGSGQYMMNRGISGKAIPGAMAMAQAAQAVATWYALDWAVDHLGYKWTLAIGSGSWLMLYVIYAASAPRSLLVVSQAFHGLAYVMFIIVTQIYTVTRSPRQRSPVQCKA